MRGGSEFALSFHSHLGLRTYFNFKGKAFSHLCITH